MKNINRRKFIRNLGLTAIGTSGAVAFLKSCTTDNFNHDGLIDCAFRLTDSNSLLNLEYYFINCRYKNGEVQAKYGPHENYMIVRLPQQHIAEQNVKSDPTAKNPIKVSTYISGYSYLVFRILFPKLSFIQKIFSDGSITSIPITKDDLLDWGCEKKFRLVVRQDLTESIFETKKIDFLTGVSKTNIDSLPENRYPFQQLNSLENNQYKADSLRAKRDTLRINKIPKVYGDPITAIELPWRLIISPKLPDSSKYKFKWEIPPTTTKTKDSHKLWTATLSIAERDEYKNNKKKSIEEEGNNERKSNVGITNLLNQLELMILGSPDYPAVINEFENILPTSAHRKDLVALYIKLKVIARTDKLTFTPLGATTHIHLKNNDIETALKERIGVLEWDHVISFGRDEKVKIATLFLEAEFGHKMVYVETAKRELKDGYYVLIKRNYILPLDIEKDYTNHENEVNKDGIISRFNSPFKKIKFLEIKQKEIIGSPKKLDRPFSTGVSFEFEAIDWQDNPIKLTKKINAIPFGALIPDDSPNKEIFQSVETYKSNAQQESHFILKTPKEVVDLDKTSFSAEKQQILDFEKIDEKIKSIKLDLKNNINSIFSKIDFNRYKTKIDDLKSEIEDVLEKYTIFLKNNSIDADETSLIKFIKDDYLKDFENINKFIVNIQSNLPKDEEIFIEVLKNTTLFKRIEVSFILVNEFISQIASILNQSKSSLNNIENIAKNIPTLIRINKQKVAYALKSEIEKLTKDKFDQTKKSISALETEYLIFEGSIRQTLNNESFDFFHEYAIIPKLNQAKVYVEALNKLVNEDIPLSISYASDYIQSQVDSTVFQIEANVSQVFAEVKEHSREAVKGVVKKISEQIPGFSVEIPVHYLTYLQNPEAIKDEAIDAITKSVNIEGLRNAIQEESNDLIFLGEEVKDAINTINDFRNVDPKKYFKDLGAKLFGSINIEEILGLGFSLPRINHLPDKIIYLFSNDKFKEFNASFVKFKPNVRGDSQLNLFISKSLKNVNEYYSYTELSNFSIGIMVGNTEVITIIFERFKITSSSNQTKKTDIKIADVKIGGPLEFIAKLAEKFTTPGNGMRIVPSSSNLDVSYSVAFPDIQSPSFNFRNLQFVIGLIIPFDPNSLKPISFKFGVNHPDNKFLISAGIYGGRGHCLLTATPKGIQVIDVAIEMGAYASLNFGGIAKGEVYLFFGFWFVYDKQEDFIKAVAYVLCAGSATVFGFITIGVRVLISLTYVKRGNKTLFYGEAIVSYSVKVAFFKKSFSIRYYKKIAGSGGDNSSQVSNKEAKASLFAFDLFNSDTKNKDLSENRQFVDIFEDEEKLKLYYQCFK